MRLQRKLTNKEWKEIGEKYKDGGVHMYRGKKTFFYNGEKIWDIDNDEWLIYDEQERDSWQVVIILPGVEIIPFATLCSCKNVKAVIMADTVKRIERCAFQDCESLEFVRLSTNLEYIGRFAFLYCQSLTSIFIPPSCREIGFEAFGWCEQLLILGLPQNLQLDESVFQQTALIKKSPVSIDEYGWYDRNDEEHVVQWIKSINNEETYALHRACASYNPLSEIIYDLVMRKGIKAMRMTNSIGITPSQYLEANKFSNISEKEIVSKYILDMMGEIV